MTLKSLMPAWGDAGIRSGGRGSVVGDRKTQRCSVATVGAHFLVAASSASR